MAHMTWTEFLATEQCKAIECTMIDLTPKNPETFTPDMTDGQAQHYNEFFMSAEQADYFDALIKRNSAQYREEMDKFSMTVCEMERARESQLPLTTAPADLKIADLTELVDEDEFKKYGPNFGYAY